MKYFHFIQIKQTNKKISTRNVERKNKQVLRWHYRNLHFHTYMNTPLFHIEWNTLNRQIYICINKKLCSRTANQANLWFIFMALFNIFFLSVSSRPNEFINSVYLFHFERWKSRQKWANEKEFVPKKIQQTIERYFMNQTIHFSNCMFNYVSLFFLFFSLFCFICPFHVWFNSLQIIQRII